jgi:ferredoxin--NADP+ reductase
MSQLFKTATVTRLEPAGPDAWTLYWKRTFEFRPGQVVALGLEPNGEQRLYSLATGSSDGEAGVLFNLVADGWLTPRLAELSPGGTVFVSEPFGSFIGEPHEAVWIANGTGVAPFLSMLLSGMGAGKTLIQGARTRAQFYGHGTASALLGDSYIRCASADEGEGLYAGRLTAFLDSREWTDDRPYFLCGSAAMIVEARDILIRRGVSYHRILSEVYF